MFGQTKTVKHLTLLILWPEGYWRKTSKIVFNDLQLGKILLCPTKCCVRVSVFTSINVWCVSMFVFVCVCEYVFVSVCVFTSLNVWCVWMYACECVFISISACMCLCQIERERAREEIVMDHTPSSCNHPHILLR